MRDCSCGGDQLLAMAGGANAGTVRNATTTGVGASVFATALLASLPLVQCSRHSTPPWGTDFDASAAQWLDVDGMAAAEYGSSDGSNVIAHACAANAPCSPRIPSRVTTPTQRREVRHMAKLDHVRCRIARRVSAKSAVAAHALSQIKRFFLPDSRISGFGPKLARSNRRRCTP